MERMLPETEAKILSDYQSNKPLKDIVMYHNVTRQSVYNVLKRNNIVPARQDGIVRLTAPLTKKAIAKLITYYQTATPENTLKTAETDLYIALGKLAYEMAGNTL